MPPSARSVPGVDGRVFVRNTVMNIGSFHIVPTQPIAVIVRKIKQTYSKREHFSSSPYYEPQAPARWPAAQNNSTICHTGQDLTGHPWSVRLGSGYNKNEVIHFNLLEDLRDLVVSPHQFSATPLTSCAPKWWVCWRKEPWKRFPQLRASQASTAVTSSCSRMMVV